MASSSLSEPNNSFVALDTSSEYESDELSDVEIIEDSPTSSSHTEVCLRIMFEDAPFKRIIWLV